VTPRATKSIESRLFWIGAGLVLAGSILAGLAFGFRNGLSFLSGGALGAINLLWLRHALNAAFESPKRPRRMALAGFFLRLLLIPLVLYAMIRFLFWGTPAAVAGLAVFYCSVFVEGVLEALDIRSRQHGRAQ
jgi:hypothetical protein